MLKYSYWRDGMEKKSQQILDNLGYELVELGLDERWLSHPFFPQIIREIKKRLFKIKSR